MTITQQPKKYDLVAIDDAFIDKFYNCHPEFFASRPLENIHGECAAVKRGDTVVAKSEQHAAEYADGLEHTLTMSGGGSANAAVHMCRRGAKTAFSGLLGESRHADMFRHDIVAAGVDLHEINACNPEATGVCRVFVNPDGQRTMVTSLPLNIEIKPEDLNEALLKDTKIVFTQAYRWTPSTRDAFLHAFATTRKAGGKAAFCLSAPFCVDRERLDFLNLLNKGKIDILFGNEEEFQTLYPGKTTKEIQSILKSITSHGKCGTIVMTLGAEGAVIFDQGNTHNIPAVPVNVVDTTGAGDAYAAGVMYGISQGMHITEAGQLGAEWAAEVISHYGARKPADPKNEIMADGAQLPLKAKLAPIPARY